MQAVLSDYNITSILNRVHPDMVLSLAAIAYIQKIFTPLTLRINNIPRNNSGEELVRQVTRGNPDLEYIEVGLIRAAAKYTDKKPPIIIYLIEEVLNLTGNYIRDQYQDNVILPWDIQYIINIDMALRILIYDFDPNNLNTRTMPNTLPVNIYYNNNEYQHELIREFAMGLLVFINASKCHIQASMFNAPLIITNRFVVTDPNKYYGWIVKIGDNNYSLNDKGIADFMQGIITGANWCGVDHHQYWSNLFMMDDDKYIPMTF